MSGMLELLEDDAPVDGPGDPARGFFEATSGGARARGCRRAPARLGCRCAIATDAASHAAWAEAGGVLAIRTDALRRPGTLNMA